MTNRCNSVVVLGFTINDKDLNDIAAKSAVLPTQTHNFAWNIVNALSSAQVKTSLLSVLPVPNFPEYPHIVIRSSSVDQRETRGITLGFINLLVLKHLTRFLSCLKSGTRFIRKEHPDVLLVHGVHTPFLLFARIVKRAIRIPICVVMTDPPGVIRDSDGALSRVLKKFDRRLVKMLVDSFDGSITLTPALAKDFAPRIPSLALEGFVGPNPSESPTEKVDRDEFVIAYAGGISAEYGVENLVKAFRCLTDSRIRLNVYGKGPLDQWVISQCERDSRISHQGLLKHDDVLTQMKDASVLVNPRPIAQEFVKYSFPSKLLEYMSLGVPVITTRLTGIPEEYLDHVQVTDDDTVAALSRSIESVRLNYGHAADRARKAQVFVQTKKSISAQGSRIATFLSLLCTKSQPDVDLDLVDPRAPLHIRSSRGFDS